MFPRWVGIHMILVLSIGRDKSCFAIFADQQNPLLQLRSGELYKWHRWQNANTLWTIHHFTRRPSGFFFWTDWLAHCTVLSLLFRTIDANISAGGCSYFRGVKKSHVHVASTAEWVTGWGRDSGPVKCDPELHVDVGTTSPRERLYLHLATKPSTKYYEPSSIPG